MRIHRLRLAGFRGVTAREVHFATEGVTVIHGDNEIGKSSLAEAIDLVLEYRDDSKAAPVRDVSPKGHDVATEIEIELMTGPYHLTLMKRFNRERATTLHIHRPRTEQLTGRDAHERVRQVLSETLDESLWKALRIQQGQQPGQADLQGQTSLAAALDDAAQAALGTNREINLIERTDAEYLRFFTPTGQRNKDLERRAREHRAARDVVESLRQRIDALDADLARHDLLEREVAELDAETNRHRRRVATLDSEVRAIDAARAAVARLETAAATAALAQAEAEGQLEKRRQLAGSVATVKEQLDALVAELAQGLTRLDKAQGALTAAEAEAAATNERRRLARELAKLRREDLFRLRDMAKLDEQRAAAEQLTLARQALDRAEFVCRQVQVDRKSLERLDAAHDRVIAAQARLESQSPVLTLEAIDGADITIDGEHTTVAAGEVFERIVSGTLELEAGGVRIRIAGGGSVEALAADLDIAENDFLRQLEAVGASSLPDAREQHRRRVEAERIKRETAPLVAKLAEIAVDEDGLAERLAELEDRWASRPDLPAPAADLTDAARLSAEAEDDAEKADRRAEKALEAAAAARALVAELDSERRRATALADHAREQLSVLEVDLTKARSEISDTDLEAAAYDAAVTATEAIKAHLEADDRLAERRPDELVAALAAAEQGLSDLSRRRDAAVAERIALAARVAALGDNGLHDQLQEAEAACDAAARESERWEREAEAAALLRTTLHDHRAQAQAAYLAPLRSRIEELGRIVFGPSFAVELDADLAITTRTLDGVTLDLHQLSVGAQEQMAVIARLACATLVAADGGVPLILDDALGFSDTGRLERLGAMFASAALDAQVIVLTCMPERYRGVGPASVVALS